VYQKVLEIPDGERRQPDIFRQMPTSIALSYERMGIGRKHTGGSKKRFRPPPETGQPLFGGRIAGKMGDFAGAAALYERIIQVPASHTRMLQTWKGSRRSPGLSGKIHAKREMYPEAEQAFRRCIERYPKFSIPIPDWGSPLEAGKAGRSR